MVAGSNAGTWRAHLKVNKRRTRRRLEELKKRKQKEMVARLESHGIPFALTVQARSSLRLRVSVAQSSRRPGATATLTATLTESGIPLGKSASVTAVISAPTRAPGRCPSPRSKTACTAGRYTRLRLVFTARACERRAPACAASHSHVKNCERSRSGHAVTSVPAGRARARPLRAPVLPPGGRCLGKDRPRARDRRGAPTPVRSITASSYCLSGFPELAGPQLRTLPASASDRHALA